METTYFHEIQKVKNPYIIGIVVVFSLIGIAVFVYGIVLQLIFDISFGDKPMSDLELFLVGIFVILLDIGIIIMLFTAKLEVLVDDYGIRYRYFPFFSKFRKIAKNTISKFYIRKYRPIMEYGGWGIRFSLTGKGIAYNVSGTTGMQLELVNGKMILFGTQSPELFTSALNRIFVNK